MIAKRVVFFSIFLFSISLVSLAEPAQNIFQRLGEAIGQTSKEIIADPVIKNMEKRHHVKTGLVKYNPDDDMPPEEHRDMWGRVESKKGNCWVHVKTFKKICDQDLKQ
ncbi:hypothetical protein [Methylobacter sp. sgz302048]|uniref:hypothetical protein n=1 Tax=Methylobacter sp. sgz302048 TaxID=3455945 RepID=UPI003F9EDC45